MIIRSLHAREILDSRGNPTVETELVLSDGTPGRASVPSGASTGSREAVELRDNDVSRYGGKGVLKAVQNVNDVIAPDVIGKEFSSQAELDNALITLDGTITKSNLGANAILSVSSAFAHAAANSEKIPLFKYLRSLSENPHEISLPLPLCNVINGGQHASFSTDIQEFMILPVGFPTFRDAIRASAEVFHALKGVLAREGYVTTVGDEGGYAPAVRNGNREALDLMSSAIASAGYTLGTHFVFALDVAASEFFADGAYSLHKDGRSLSSSEMIDWCKELASAYPIVSLEDPLDENDWKGWSELNKEIGSHVQLVGDDLFVTNTEYIARGIKEQSANAVLIKLNQIGTISETVRAIDAAHAAGWKTIVSHRSGETDDTTIAHLAVGLGVGQIKTGSLSRGERIAKYNELLRIEELLQGDAKYSGNSIFHQ